MSQAADSQNAFQRAAAQPTLVDDRKNRFQRHTENVAARRADTSQHDQRVTTRENQRANWVGDNRDGGVKTTSGIALDPKTAELKAASDASRKLVPAAAPQVMPSEATILAISEHWAAKHPEFYPSALNLASMRAFVRKNFDQGIPFGTELLDAGLKYLWENNHLERSPNARPRKRGEIVNSGAPIPFIYDTPEEQQSRAEFAQLFAKQTEAEEAERAKSMSFDELQREVKSGRKTLTREQAANLGAQV
jgi:hypothetical protein